MSARWATQPDVDTCGMPVGFDETCGLPGDHLGGCEPRRIHVPRCLCSHTHANHTRGTGQCWSAACGCRQYREKDQ